MYGKIKNRYFEKDIEKRQKNRKFKGRKEQKGKTCK